MDRTKAAFIAAAIALSLASAYYLYRAVQPVEERGASASETQQRIELPLTENFTLVNPNTRVFQVSGESCQATIDGVQLTKEGAICTVTINRQMYPHTKGVGGFCSDLDTTSPQNSATQLVLKLRGMRSFAFELLAAKQWRLVSTDEQPSVSISGFIEVNGTYELVACDNLPADPN